MQCPFMYTTFCAACVCGEKLPCASVERSVCKVTASATDDIQCEESSCPCWLYSAPPLARAVRFLQWYLPKLNVGRVIDDETAFALGQSVGWLSLATNGPKVLTDEEVVTYGNKLTEAFSAGLSHSNPNFFEAGGSFLGTARSHNPSRE